MSTKNSFITGKDFYVFNEIFEEDKGVHLKFFKPEDVKLMFDNGQVVEIEVCISKETWKEFQNKIKHSKEDAV